MSEHTTEVVHELECARRLRWQLLARAGEPAYPSAQLLGEVAERIHHCCGHSRLKAHRLAYGWTVEQAVEALHNMCDDEELGARGLAARSWLSWEAGGRPGSDYQDLLARLFRSGPVRLGFACDYSGGTDGNPDVPSSAAGDIALVASSDDLPASPEPVDVRTRRAGAAAAPSSVGVSGQQSPSVVWRGRGAVELVTAAPSVCGADGSFVDRWGCVGSAGEDVVMMAADESARFTQFVEQTNVGPHTVEQFWRDIDRLVTAYPNRPVFPSFIELRELRNRAFQLLEGRQHPNQSRELHLVCAVLCGVLSNASFDLGYLQVAETQARTAYLCAELAGHNGLRAWIRGTQALVAYWDDRLHDAVALTASGWQFEPEAGTAKVRLASIAARAHARLGDDRVAEDALAHADQARSAVTVADSPGGMMAFPLAKQQFYASTARLWLGGTQRYRSAEGDAEHAVASYEEVPAEQRRIGELCLARLDLAACRLGQGGFDGASQEVRTVMTAASQRRTDSVVRRLTQFSRSLDRPAYRNDTDAQNLRDEIASFCATPATLPAGADQ